MDFVPQSMAMQTVGNVGPSPGGYTVDKFPEVAYYRIGTPLWDDRLTWYSENRATAMRLHLPSDTPGNRGFNAAQSTALFGIANPATRFDDALRADGFDEHTRYRGDTRQELQAPLKLGVFNVTPYAVGRVTAYDDGFEEFSGDDENLRLWGSVGVRVDTNFSQKFDDVESRTFDLHRLRHVIAPSMNVFFASTTINQQDLPVYDYDVESLAEGGVAKFGVRNTLQTQRGGESRWRSVDWIRLDTDFMVATDDHPVRESPISRFFDFRPEASLVGNSFWSELAIQVTDTMTFDADVNYSFESDQVERYDVGITIDHTPRFTTFINYRDIAQLDSSILRYGFDYLLTPKYYVAFSQSYDLRASRSRDLTVTLTRRLPQWLFMVTANWDLIDDSATFGIALAPEGIGSGISHPGVNPFLMR